MLQNLSIPAYKENSVPSDGEGEPILPDMDHPASSTRKKPGAPSFQPYNTIHSPLPLATVRGDNVPSSQRQGILAAQLKRPHPPSRYSPPFKTFKESHTTRPQVVHPTRTIFLDDEDTRSYQAKGVGRKMTSQVPIQIDDPSPPQPISQTSSAYSKKGSKWNRTVSNTEEFRNLEDRMRPGPNYAKYSKAPALRETRHSSRFSNQPTASQPANYAQQRSLPTAATSLNSRPSNFIDLVNNPQSPEFRHVNGQPVRASSHKKNPSVPEVQIVDPQPVSSRVLRNIHASHPDDRSHQNPVRLSTISALVQLEEESDELQETAPPKRNIRPKRIYHIERPVEHVKTDELQESDDEKYANGHDIPTSSPVGEKPSTTSDKTVYASAGGSIEFWVKDFISTHHISRSPSILRQAAASKALNLTLHTANGSLIGGLRTDKLTTLSWALQSRSIILTGSKDTVTNQNFTAVTKFESSEEALKFSTLVQKLTSAIKVIKRGATWIESAYDLHAERILAGMALLGEKDKRREEELKPDDDAFDLMPPAKRLKSDGVSKQTRNTGPKRYEQLAQQKTEPEPRPEMKTPRKALPSTSFEANRRSTRKSHVEVVVEVPSPREARKTAQHVENNIPEDFNNYSTSTRRMTRGVRQTIRDPSPLPFERYSRTHNLGRPWSQAVMYPMTGKGKANVNFEDLERLDDGEFLNDNLVEFGMRWAENSFPKEPNKVYCFNTHFYTTLTSGKNRRLNYDAVKKWTKGIDIFDYEYILVPVNENMHWYLAIICHAGLAFSKPVVIEDSQETPPPEETSKFFNNVPELSNLGEGVKNVLIKSKTELQERNQPQTVREQPTAKLSPLPCDRMQEMSLDDKAVIPDSQEDNSENSAQQVLQAESRTHNEESRDDEVVVMEMVEARASTPENTTQLRKLTSPAASKGRSKRRYTHRKIGTDRPTIVILDSMSTTHPATISNLKEYLIREAEDKRDRKIGKETFKGANARVGIPQQDNFYDCGVFVCGYIEKLMSNPTEFGEKLLNQEFNVMNDWPEMNTSKMRSRMRDTLLKLAQEQEGERAKFKLQKKAAKRAAINGPATELNKPEVPQPIVSYLDAPDATAPTAVSAAANGYEPRRVDHDFKDAPKTLVVESKFGGTVCDDLMWDLHQDTTKAVEMSDKTDNSKRKISPSSDDKAEPPRKKTCPSPLERSFSSEDIKLLEAEPKPPVLREPYSDTLFEQFPEADHQIVTRTPKRAANMQVPSDAEIVILEDETQTPAQTPVNQSQSLGDSVVSRALPYKSPNSEHGHVSGSRTVEIAHPPSGRTADQVQRSESDVPQQVDIDDE